MFTVHSQSMEWGGANLSLETGKIARQAHGAVMVSYGDGRVLCTVTVAPLKEAYGGFFPLSVHYQEKAFAAGKIPGGFLKRESKPLEHEVLSSRLIDRAIRPLFPKDFRHEVQVVCTVFSYDPGTDIVVAAINGASVALQLAGLPLKQKAAAIRLGCDSSGEWVVNPSASVLKEMSLDLVVAGTREGLLMVESQAQGLSEDRMLEALEKAHGGLVPVFDLMDSFVKAARDDVRHTFPYEEDLERLRQETKRIETLLAPLCHETFENLCQESDRKIRGEILRNSKEDVFLSLAEHNFHRDLLEEVFQDLWRQHVRSYILKNSQRLDKRGLDQVRPISAEVAVLPRVHGSALFTRGNTQVLVATTLGGKDDGQFVENLDGVRRESFSLHYNFPPFSVGEVGRLMGPGRREIGHGRLAWKAIAPALPSSFPYTVRVVSEVTESYGSSSMATVCGTTLALLDAGVPLESPVAGIAMGLIFEGEDRFAVLSDISGTEDHLGDMDFKVAGTQAGITALQMDLKISSLSMGIIREALLQALPGRMHILEVMAQQSISVARKNFSKHAPSVKTLSIAVDRIRDLIGPGGKNIRDICEKLTVKIDVSEDGKVTIFGPNETVALEAEKRVRFSTGSMDPPTPGETYQGVVMKTIDSGAFVKFGFPDDGFVHISEIRQERVEHVSDVLKAGDSVWVKFLGYDNRNRVRLTMKGCDVHESDA